MSPEPVRSVAVSFEGEAPAQPLPLRAPDTPLGRARLARGWSRERTVRALLALAERWGWQVAAESSLKVQLHRWEHQQGLPGETYRVLLCALFQAPPAELGFTQAPAPAPGATAPKDSSAELSARVDHLESLLGRLTDALTRSLGVGA
ncbi:XRE family transcriptional regulator [Streptomyces sp. NPDC051567]|uniref:XRE family transcriptional regulator n=1 Tax=Streptomyces sp. NPDC051567 TaxID=3365660 RepID=UPI0037B87461